MAPMDYRRELEKRNSKNLWIEIVNDVGTDKDKFSKLMVLFLGDDKRLALSSSQPVGMIGEKQPQLITPYLVQMIQHLETNPIDGVKRNTLRTFQFNDIPEESEGLFFDLALNFVTALSEPVAIKAFSITVLRKLAQKYPELAQEVIPVVENILEETESVGLMSRGNKELIELRLIQKTILSQI